MLSAPSAVPGILGNTSLSQFDVIIIGSGAGGSMAARTLTVIGGKKVLILEAGPNYFMGLDDPAAGMPVPLFSNDELKMSVRKLIQQDPFLEPRTFRAKAADTAAVNEDVNVLPRTVGGAAVHADMKYPRFNVIDFRIATELQSNGITYDGTNFSDWPVQYDELEPFYTEAERLTGVQGQRGADPFESTRSADYVMPPGVPMYVGRLLSQGASAKGYHPFPYPTAVNSRPYGGRPPCVDCGFCSGYGCPNNSKCSPAVTTLREALLTGNCQVRYNCMVTQLTRSGGGHITGVTYIDGNGATQTATADQYIVSASAIESARLCLLSNVGNSSGMVGRNLMFHFQTLAVGIFKQRLHGERGRSVTNGMADFRGVMPGGTAIDPTLKLGGIIEFGTNSEAIAEATNSLQALGIASRFTTITLKQLLLNSPLRARLAAMEMQAEDAPQLTNQIDLDPQIKDVFGLPVPRVTYSNSKFELDARAFYGPKMLDVLKGAGTPDEPGAQYGFIAPADSPSQSRHVMGTLRMGSDPTTSVCDAFGKLHDVDNLYCMDGGVFVSSSGYNPTLTIITLALRAAGNLLYPNNPQRVLPL